MTDSQGVQPALGFTVAVTAQRRAEEFTALLERRGAKVLQAPAVRIIPVVDDGDLSAVTKLCLSEPPDVLVATTGIGFRGWMEAAGEWGLAAELTEVLADVRIVARGPKAKGAVRAAGLSEVWSPESESSQEVLEWLLTEGVDGLAVAVQLHGHPLPDFVGPLRDAGATVVEISPYSWLPPIDTGPVIRLLDAIVSRQVDAVTFTSAPAALVLLDQAQEAGVTRAVRDAFNDRVRAVCVGPVTAEVLERVGVPTDQPERARLGALARETIECLGRQEVVVVTRETTVRLRGSGVVIDDEFHPLAPACMAALRVLVDNAGNICSRAAIAKVLPGGTDNDDHAVDAVIARLRRGMGHSSLIQTVVRRGYRFAL